MMKFQYTLVITMSLLWLMPLDAQQAQKQKKSPGPFRWVNPLNAKQKQLPGLRHATFTSPSMMIDVGYCIYLPSGYQKNPMQRYPVVYYLHGGRPGSETKSVALVPYIDRMIKAGKVPPMIYVFVNGGPVSHYNYPEKKQAMGEDVFIKELIPHIDRTYRTIADQSGRGLEGFSQGGRGTARILFKYPHLFCSAAAGGGGYATEKRISENNGEESKSLKFAPGYNTWDHARRYAKKIDPKLNIMIFVGTKGFNYQNNLEYMAFLKELKIPFRQLIVADAPHSAKIIYDSKAEEITRFHADNFQAALNSTDEKE